MKTFFFLICVLVCLGAGRVVAATPAAAPPQGNRYLLVVATSKAMKPALPAVQQSVATLLAEKMSGQLQRGDSLGLWTYNDTLYAGDFPVQVWSAESSPALARRVEEFLGQQKFSGAARLQTVVTNLAPVIADSERLTILIFSDGFELISGTPFDAVINRVFTQHREELRRARVPFLTVLQAVGGKVIHCTVNAANGPIKLPEFPKPPAPPAPPKPAPPVVVVVKTNAPLIVNHSKPATNLAPVATNPVVAPVVLPQSSAVAVTAAPPAVAIATTSVVVVVSNPPISVAASPASNVTAQAPERLVSTSQPRTKTVSASPAESVPGWVWVLVAAAVGAGLFFWLGRRGRATSHTSAITESLDRRKQ